jgi:hypothetical protein
MRLILTENQKFLIRFNHNSEIEVFSLNPIQPLFSCKGRIIGFSRDSSLMLVWNEGYLVYDLAQGTSFSIQEDNREDFAPEVLLDVRKNKPGLNVQIFDLINDTVLHELTMPEEKGVNKRIEGTGKIIASPYVMVQVLRDSPLAIENHIFDLSTGKHRLTIDRGIDHYQPKQNSLFLLHFFSASRIKFGEEIIIEDIIFLENPLGMIRRWPVSAIASFPTNRNQMAFVQESTVYFVDILPPEEVSEDPQQIREYATSLSSKVYAWGHINALCFDDSGRSLYISYSNGNFRVYDIQAREFSEDYRMPTKIPKATRRGLHAPK